MKFINGHWTYETDDWQKEIKDALGDDVEYLDEEPNKYLIVGWEGMAKIYVRKQEGIDALRKKYGKNKNGEAICGDFEMNIGDHEYGHMSLDVGGWNKVIEKDSKPKAKAVCMEGKCPKCNEEIVIWGQFD